jgi:hypothetical protein
MSGLAPSAPTSPQADATPEAGIAAGGEHGFTVEPLQGWHLPLLDDPALLPLQPLLRRAVLLAVPERLITALAHRRPLAPQVLVALQRDGVGRPAVLGLIASRRLNRSGSCWQVEHLRLRLGGDETSGSPVRSEVMVALLREAIARGRGAASWIATAASLDAARLACLRELGFQPQRTDRLWRWVPGPAVAGLTPPGALQLLPLSGATAPLLWHLEQACCPAQLRQLLDRRIEDLLDQSHGRGWLLLDPNRNQAVAGVRWLADRPGGGQVLELSVHPGHRHLIGPAAELLLRRIAAAAPQPLLWLTSEVGDAEREAWLATLGADVEGEQVLMARSVWRRQGKAPLAAARRIEAVLEQLQPRRQPMPTPAGPVAGRS